MKQLREPLGAIYDIDDTLLNNQPEVNDPLSNLHQVTRLVALHGLARKHGGDYESLLDIKAQENYDSFGKSHVSTVAGAFYVLLRDHGLIVGDFDPQNPIITELITLKAQAYQEWLAESSTPIEGADTFVSDLANYFGLRDKSAVASSGYFEDIMAFIRKNHLNDILPESRIIDISRVSKPKPNAEPFDKAFRTLELPDAERPNVIAIDDDPRGIASARKAGLFVVGLCTRHTPDELRALEAAPDLVVESYAELRDHFDLPPVASS